MKKAAVALFLLLPALLAFGRSVTEQEIAVALKRALRARDHLSDAAEVQVSNALATGKDVCIEYRASDAPGQSVSGLAVYRTEEDLVFLDNSWIWERACLSGKYGQRRNGKDVTRALNASLTEPVKSKTGVAIVAAVPTPATIEPAPSRMVASAPAQMAAPAPPVTVVRQAAAIAPPPVPAPTPAPATAPAPAPVVPVSVPAPSVVAAVPATRAPVVAPAPVAAPTVVPTPAPSVAVVIPPPAVAVPAVVAAAPTIVVPVATPRPPAPQPAAIVAPSPAPAVPVAATVAASTVVPAPAPVTTTVAVSAAPPIVTPQPVVTPSPVATPSPVVVSTPPPGVSASNRAAAVDAPLHGVTIIDNNGALGAPTSTVSQSAPQESLADAARRVRRSR